MPTDDESKALQEDGLGDADLKIILLGDSAVGKSKLVERFMMNEYQPRQLSTFALTLFRKEFPMDDGSTAKIDIWDTAGQERFSSMHPSYYFGASACILVFDVTRKTTYQHLADWYKELREYCENVPCFLAANKIDVDLEVTNKKFKFAETHNLGFHFVSAADGTNVVKIFEEAIHAGLKYKKEGGDFMADVLDLLNEPPRK
ncbi:rab family, other [Saprolegnia diclina VS20]|uniref:Rab family, other n=1 Tax=Saprolegnia diclina (strain VS20) TaxID=1156394 RepID=T0R548_SAPDV|nr:rab family, other [Saprolegnia diclina VS20]EQC42076.1 rab family, other [Saprolegnia diclina VS20]|eukprot:XP_008604645.1 rab family, other [Saprolegnia diclina VS20]